jgi:Rrf2 family iron-sulfur cluster assembly transcriptional regulator
MRLTTKGRFAVTAMMDLAMRGEDGPVALASVSERQKISLSYLEQLFGKLRRHKLVDSVRGPGGGYCIARPFAQVTVADIIRAVDEQLDATQCGGRENCHDEHRCMTHDLWSTLNAKMFDYLASVTLAELVECEKLKRGPATIVLEDKRRLGPQPRGRLGRDKVPAVA